MSDSLFRDWRVAGKDGEGTCATCGEPATHQACFAGEPWVPFCKEHGLPAYYEHNRREYWQPKEPR
jgi:pyruvate-formate lyase-activating enzyme